jgi:predicted dithiol-disulfide oxidoreductase (DUF899 family)
MQHKVVSREEWTQARKALLAKEKALTRQRDALNRERLELPWVKVDKSYVFDSPGGEKSLVDLFDGRSQLIVKHFMLGPDWQEGCVGCSFGADHLGGPLMHLGHHDITIVAVSRASLEKIQAYKQRMGWDFPWVSSFGSDFNFDYHVSFTPQELANKAATYNYETIDPGVDELPGFSAFYKDDNGDIFHTYSTYARGAESMSNSFAYMDIAPKGRNEPPGGNFSAWARRHDKYEDDGRQKPAKAARHGCCD